ncbi:hypothetical protein HDU76_009933, partial [Blyttiomyces sp. JEL0837]
FVQQGIRLPIRKKKIKGEGTGGPASASTKPVEDGDDDGADGEDIDGEMDAEVSH